MSRHDDLRHFYSLLDKLSDQLGGPRTLVDLGRYRDWPSRGVYFFFEPGETRTHSGDGQRLVRVGTHALNAGSRSTLRQRLSQHRGSGAGSGNHRGSIFRLLVGQALIAKGMAPPCTSWGIKGSKRDAVRILELERDELHASEEPVEKAVSAYIGQMPFLWLPVEDEPGPDSSRAFIERNAIALLSNKLDKAVDPASHNWLGLHSNRRAVVESGLWNQRHTDERYDPAFLSEFDQLIEMTA